MEKRQEEIDRLLQIPQEEDVWQLGVEQYLVRWVGFAGRAWHPWMTVIFSVTHQAVIANLPFWTDPPTEEFLWWVFWRAVVCPARPATPHRPTELQLQDDAIGHALKPWVERLGITVVLKDKMEAVEKSLFEADEEFYGPRSAEP
jgi:hypothetical protein